MPLNIYVSQCSTLSRADFNKNFLEKYFPRYTSFNIFIYIKQIRKFHFFEFP